MATLALRQILAGRHRLDRVVSESASAVVYEGAHLTLGVRTAVKVLRRSAADRAELERELAALRRIESEHVVRPLDYGLVRVDAASEVPFLVLEWCDGGTLDDRRAKSANGRLGVGEAVALILPVVDAIAAAHRAGVTHGDLKPSNVLFASGPNGEPSPRVIDFGMAALAGLAQARGFSPAYAAPEQVHGGAIGPPTDVHALALMFTELVTGISPYGDLAAIAALEPLRPTPRRFGLEIGPLEAVLARALALDPAQRFPDAGAFAAALRAHAPTGLGVVPSLLPPTLRSEPAAGHVVVAPPAASIAVVSAPVAAIAMSPPATLRDPQRAGGPVMPATVRDPRASAPAGGLKRRAWVIGASSGALALAAGGVAAYRWLGADAAPSSSSRRAARAASSGAPSAAASVAAPGLAASRATLADFQTRARAGGFEITGAHSNNALSLRKDGVDWNLFFVDFDYADFAPEVRRRQVLEAVGRMALDARAGGYPLAYGVEGSRALLFQTFFDPSHSVTPAILRAGFAALTTGLRFDATGDTTGATDPASAAVGRAPTAWSATRLADLSFDELDSRVRAAGAEIDYRLSPPISRLDVRVGTIKGLVTFVGLPFEGLALGDVPTPDSEIGGLRRERKDFCFSREGPRAVVAVGPAPFSDVAFLQKVLTGLAVKVERG